MLVESKEPSLKSVECGFLFVTCNPWLFGPGRRFIVNEEQKQALIRIVKPGLGTYLFTFGIIAYICVVGTLWLGPIRNNLTALNLSLAVITIIAPLYAASIFAVRFSIRRVEGIVSTAVPTDARLSIVERWKGIGLLIPTNILWIGLLGSGVSVATELVSAWGAVHAVRIHPQEILAYWPIVKLLMSMILGAFFAWTLYGRPQGAKV